MSRGLRWKSAPGHVGRHKYGAKRTEVDGISFDSQREARHYLELKTRERFRDIRDLELQPRYKIEINGEPLKIRSRGFPGGRTVTYVADFRYVVTATGETVVEDIKGLDTPVARLKRALVEHLYGIRIEVIGGTYRSDKRRRKKTDE